MFGIARGKDRGALARTIAALTALLMTLAVVRKAETFPIPFVAYPDAIAVAVNFHWKPMDLVAVPGLRRGVVVIRIVSSRYNDEDALAREIYRMLFVEYAKIKFYRATDFVVVEAFLPNGHHSIDRYKTFIFPIDPSGKWEPRTKLHEATLNEIISGLGLDK